MATSVFGSRAQTTSLASLSCLRHLRYLILNCRRRPPRRIIAHIPRSSDANCLSIRLHLAPATAKMLSRRIARASASRPATTAIAARRLPLVQTRTFLPRYNDKVDEMYPASDYPELTEAQDPNMNGGYVQPPPIKRQFRDPHADWWDKQERRNFGEPCHEDYDTLGMFTPHAYTWVSPKKGLLQVAAFIATFLSVCYAVKLSYPDYVSYPREFEGGLEKELGGSGATRARAPGDPEPFQDEVDVD